MQNAQTRERQDREWGIPAPVSRNFDCAVVTPVVDCDGTLMYQGARLSLTAHEFVIDLGAEHCELVIVVRHPEDGKRRLNNLERSRVLQPINERLRELGFAWDSPGAPRLGTWRHYLREVEKMHAVFDLLGWDLTPAEQALVDAVDAYAERCPAWVRKRIAQD